MIYIEYLTLITSFSKHLTEEMQKIYKKALFGTT